MNKKQTLVSALTTKLEDLGVILSTGTEDAVSFHADAKFWERYPEGYHSSLEGDCLEEDLSCLSVSTLEAILASDAFKPGIAFSDLWKEWGRRGFFKIDPEIIDTGDGIPVLHARHDCFLHWYKDAGFQNSYDAYCNGSNGSSSFDFGIIRRAITIPPCSSLYEEDIGADESNDWNLKFAAFRRAMFYSPAFQACVSKPVYQQLFRSNPAVFDEFMNRTDARCVHAGTDSALGLEALRERFEDSKFNFPAELEIPLAYCPHEGKRVFAVLRYNRDSVSLSWSEGGRPKQLTAHFPMWDEQAWIYEAECMDLGCESPQNLPESTYVYYCWLHLTYTLLSLSGFYCARPGRDRDIDLSPASIWHTVGCADGMPEVAAVLYKACTKFLTRDDLVDIVCK